MDGLTEGLLEVEVNPLGLLVQLYVFPSTALAPIMVELLLHIEVADPVEADGSGLTVIFTESELLQPVAVMVSVR